MTEQLQIPQVPLAPVFETDIDIGPAGNWVVTRVVMGTPRSGSVPAGEFTATSRERGMGLAHHIVSAIDRGDRISIVVVGKTLRAATSIELRKP